MLSVKVRGALLTNCDPMVRFWSQGQNTIYNKEISNNFAFAFLTKHFPFSKQTFCIFMYIYNLRESTVYTDFVLLTLQH